MQNCNGKFKDQLKKRIYNYSIKVVTFVDGLPKTISTNIIAKQLLRSATSIGANIIEAQAASSRRDFAKFLTYSLKSSNETLYWLGLLRDAKQIKNSEIAFLIKETQELAKILGSSVITLKEKQKARV